MTKAILGDFLTPEPKLELCWPVLGVQLAGEQSENEISTKTGEWKKWRGTYFSFVVFCAVPKLTERPEQTRALLNIVQALAL